MYTKGSSIIEIIIALAVLTFGITAGTLLAFSNQSIELDTQTASEALYITKDAIENVRATAQGDFSEIASLEITQSIDIYTNQIFALNSDCSKRVTSLTTWQTDAQRDKYISLTTEIADMTEALALGGGCTGFPGDEWYHPDTSNVANTNPASARGTGVDVAKINGRAYAFVTSDISGSSQDDFWAFDVEDVTQTTAPTKMTSLDTGLGLVDIAVAKQESTGKYFAYVANKEIEVPPSDPVVREQLQVIEVTNIDDPNPHNRAVLRASIELPGVDPEGSYPEGRSIFYYNNKVYIGIAETDGPEFHVFNVTNPTSPQHLGSIELTHNVNDIVVRGDYAYLATSDNSGEVMVIDISNPSAMVHPDISGLKYNAPGSADATAVYVSGNTLYAGRNRDGSQDDFFVLDIESDHTLTLNTSVDFDDNLCDIYNPTTGNYNTNQKCLKNNTAITGIQVSGKFAFLSTTNSTAGFQVWEIFDLANIKNRSAYNYSENSTDLQFFNDRVYTSNTSNNILRVIFDNPPA
ncbi:MAG: hypothetical protein COV34_02790 [Candidatus Zambryskibacteria bacterium CG10_big_fil_rev_8_21_14_0_10_42_12]|uniref:Uncharacterized protein n=1 Tax=Candidatus Zambryskibacteria bacterium CG10_big_fil_rev_8_21_14_0_10_42_12 TaxID=1975115 RepID=A0A2H0QUN1_9BACT|nr:MAG: hypothetical protein COV34_02790 [Candidatus Zambryskibacteria bacterium CG10_big_fil_rev_8_21_14_0_10_42_12]